MRVVENDGGGIKLLRKANGTSKTQTLSFCPCGDPRKRKVGDKMVVVVETAHIAVAAREKHFNDLSLAAFERNILKELPRLVARHGMTRPSHVARTIHRDIKPNCRIDRVPKPEIGDS